MASPVVSWREEERKREEKEGEDKERREGGGLVRERGEGRRESTPLQRSICLGC
jgi:hypothetical protein